MQMQFEIPDELAMEMEKYESVDWNKIIIQAIEGCVYDFTILDKLKDFWGVQRDTK